MRVAALALPAPPVGDPVSPDWSFLMKRFVLPLLAAVLSASAWAHGVTAGDLKIGHPWARPTVQGQPTGGGFLKIENTGKTAERLLGATSTVGDHLELHTMSMEGDVMRMRQVDGIDIAPGATVELKPGAFHMMIMGLKAPLKAGDKFPVTLKFQKAGEVKVEVWVETPKAASGAGAAEAHDMAQHKH
jgi:copper(I)-binding protein